MKEEKKKSAAGWIMDFAGHKKGQYITSVLVAVIGVLCGIVPFLVMGSMIQQLIAEICVGVFI